MVPAPVPGTEPMDPDARRAAFLRSYEVYSTGPILVLVIFWLVTVADPAAIAQTGMPDWLLRNIQWVITALFALDLGFRLLLAERRLAYLKSNWLDALAIIIPVARLVRLALLALALARAARGRFSRTLFQVLGVAAGVVISGSVLVWVLEASNPESRVNGLGEALWWALATVSTVGYGDVVPITPAGRLVGIVMIVVGVAVFSSFVGALQAGASQEASEDLDRQLTALQDEIAEVRGMLQAVLDRLPAPAPDATAAGEGPAAAEAAPPPEPTP